MTAAQLALAWTLRASDAVAIPTAAQEGHLRENLMAGSLVLDAPTCAQLDLLFPPPRTARPLAVV